MVSVGYASINKPPSVFSFPRVTRFRGLFRVLQPHVLKPAWIVVILQGFKMQVGTAMETVNARLLPAPILGYGRPAAIDPGNQARGFSSW